MAHVVDVVNGRVATISIQRKMFLAFWKNPGSRLGTVIAIIIMLLAVIPFKLLPFDPTVVNLSVAKEPGFWEGNFSHFLGTDFLGRDMLSRAVYGARLTLLIGFSATAVSTILGIIAGMLAGFIGKWVDAAISLVIDIQLAFPVIALAIAIIAMVGGSLTSLIFVLAVTSWAGIARLVRGQTIAAKNEIYVDAALAIGVPKYRIIERHIFPNILSPLLAIVTFEMARLILAESALSFLGLGIAAPKVTWGGMIGDGRGYLFDAWWTATIPGIFIALLVLSLNFVGDGIRDAIDPTSWSRSKK